MGPKTRAPKYPKIFSPTVKRVSIEVIHNVFEDLFPGEEIAIDILFNNYVYPDSGTGANTQPRFWVSFFFVNTDIRCAGQVTEWSTGGEKLFEVVISLKNSESLNDMLDTIAHEIRHIWQRVLKSSVCTEKDAEEYALEFLAKKGLSTNPQN